MVTNEEKIVIYSWNIPKGALSGIIESEYLELSRDHRVVKMLTSDVSDAINDNNTILKDHVISLSEINNKRFEKRRNLSFFFPGLTIYHQGSIFSGVLDLFTFLKDEKPHYIVAHQLMSAIFVFPYSFLFRVPVILILHDHPFQFKEDFEERSVTFKGRLSLTFSYLLGIYVVKRTNFVICTTKAIMRKIIPHTKKSANITTGTLGLNPPKQRSIRDRTLVLSVSKWSDFRRPEVYLEIARSLKMNCKFIIAGRWDSNIQMTKFKKKVIQLGLDHIVEVTGEVSQEELEDLYDNTRVFLRLGFNESGTGMAILEAIGHGCPVIISKSLGAAEIIHNEIEGFLVDNSNLPGIVECIEHLLVNDLAVKTMSMRAYDLAESLKIDQHIEKIKEIIDQTQS